MLRNRLFTTATSLDLSGIITDETGTGALVFNTSPNILTPTVDGVATFRGGIISIPNTTTPTSNTVLGSGAGDDQTASSFNNTIIGNNAGTAVTDGSRLTLIGAGAGQSITTGSQTTLVGWDAGRLATGSSNTALGREALIGETGQTNNGTGNTAIGASSMRFFRSASNCVAVGLQAADLNRASDITAVGANALDANTTGTLNTAVGKDALGANTTGSSSVAIGNGALAAQTTVGNNTAVGYLAGSTSTNGSNTFIGYLAGSGVTTAESIVCVGNFAGSTSLGSFNTYVGSFAGDSAAVSSTHTTAVGYAACFSQSGNNAALGSEAGYRRADGTIGTGCTNSVFIGNDARPNGDSETNQIVIGNLGRGNGSNTTTIGNSSTTGTFIPAGNLTLTNGNFIVGTSGKGIDFSATANSSGTMTSELLSDYEEGTFTVGISFGNGTTGITYSDRGARYTKIGRMVMVNGYVALSNKGSSTGVMAITGLPFSIPGDVGSYSAPCIDATNIINSGQVSGVGSGTTILLTEFDTAGVRTQLNDGDFANNSSLIFTFCYSAT